MTNLKQDFIRLCIENNILSFGEFTLKSGRASPYFFNAGLFHSGALLSALGKSYAHSINENIKEDFVLFGPAYKGIPLASVTSVQLNQLYNRNVPYCFNRKEKKDYGEGGQLVGAKLENNNIVVIDDVITAGTAINECTELIQQQSGANIIAIVIALDRQEVATGETLSATQAIQQEYGVPIYPLITLDDLIGFVNTNDTFQAHHDDITAYRNRYGTS